MKKVCPVWDGGRWKTAARSKSPASRSRERPNQACHTDRRNSITKGLISPIGPIMGVQILKLNGHEGRDSHDGKIIHRRSRKYTTSDVDLVRQY